MPVPPAAPSPDFHEKPWPPLRNIVLGYLEQARPHTIWGTGEIDVTEPLLRLKHCQRELRIAISFHAVILHALAQAAALHPGVLTYRHGRKLVTFTEVDVCTTIDRKIEGHRMPGVHCVRSAQRKSLAAINWELREAINRPVPNDPVVAQRRRFARLPAFVRRWLGGKVSANPHLLRRIYGTIGLTNLNSHGLNRPLWALPPTLCTVTVASGSIVDRLASDGHGGAVVRRHLCVTGAADHAVIDGMPLSRFTLEFCQQLESGAALDDAFIAETRRLMAADPELAGRGASA
jgi:hypothetical protein